MSARKTIDDRVYQEFRRTYESKFGSSASQLSKAIDTLVEIDKDARRGKHVLSERAIHSFFNSNISKRQFNLTTLNYLAVGLLGARDYTQALLKVTEPERDDGLEEDNKPQSTRTEHELLRTHHQRNIDRYSQVKSHLMFAPLPITDVYVDLNILEREQKRRLLRSSLAKDGSLPSLKRSETGFLIVESHLSIIEALEKYNRLMLWGRLGAGKTTTLRYLLTQAGLKKHGIYLELRKVFNNAEGNIFDHILRDFKVEANSVEAQTIETLLDAGHFTIFLDGLDEVSSNVFRTVCDQIESFVDLYSNNQFVIACRYGVYDYGFKRFTEVEACRLTLSQMEKYIRQWHKTYPNPEREKEIIKALQSDESLRRLASAPLMLSLICLSLDSGRGIPKNMYALCDDAFMTSIEKWDQNRNIRRDSTKMSKLKKIDFLGKIGFEGMDKEEKTTAWKLHELTDHARDVIKTLPSYNPDSLEEDAQKEVRALEGYHSLLKQDTKGTYSFDSPIYQYFSAANYIVRQEDPKLIESIVNTRLLERQWKDIILMVAERRSNAEPFLKCIFRKITQLSQLPRIQTLLAWLYKVSEDSGVASNSYRGGILAIDTEINFYLSRYSIDDETRRIAHALATNLRELNRRHGTIRKSKEPFNIRLDLVCLHTLAEDYAFSENISLRKPSEFASSYLSLLKSENFSFKRILAEQSQVAEKLAMLDLKSELLGLAETLPVEGRSDQQDQWRTWAERLRAILIEYLGVGHNVSLSAEDADTLKNYLYATNVLAECLLVDASVDYETRQLLRRNVLLSEDRIHKSLLAPGV